MSELAKQEELWGGTYAVCFEGGFAYFYDDGEPEFSTPAACAQTQQMRDALAVAYDLGMSRGRNWGRDDLKRDFRKLLDL
jgi:hypothetical protein